MGTMQLLLNMKQQLYYQEFELNYQQWEEYNANYCLTRSKNLYKELIKLLHSCFFRIKRPMNMLNILGNSITGTVKSSAI